MGKHLTKRSEKSYEPIYRCLAESPTLHAQGQISPAVLVLYRVASARDGQDPAPMLAEIGVGDVMHKASATDHVARLIDEADRYIAALHGRGVAEVRAGLNQWRGSDVRVTPQANAVVNQHLSAALATLRATHLALAQAIEGAEPHLTWITYDGYPPEEIGSDFAKGHAYTSLIGEAGNIAACDYDLGIFLIAPHVLYRDHHHAAPELYAPLTGPHGWRFGPQTPLITKPAHHPVWNDAHRPHMTKVGPTPFLALFSWIRDVAQVAQVIPAPDWPALEALRLDP